jgi:hypothetical protein
LLSSIANLKIAIKAPPHVDFCFGYAGVPSTRYYSIMLYDFLLSNVNCKYRPRLVGTVELRSNGLDAILVSYVSISLNQYEKVLMPSKSGAPLGLTATKVTNHKIIGKEIMLFQAAVGTPYESVTTLDLPFTIDIPSVYEELPAASLKLPGGDCETT